VVKAGCRGALNVLRAEAPIAIDGEKNPFAGAACAGRLVAASCRHLALQSESGKQGAARPEKVAPVDHGFLWLTWLSAASKSETIQDTFVMYKKKLAFFQAKGSHCGRSITLSNACKTGCTLKYSFPSMLIAYFLSS